MPLVAASALPGRSSDDSSGGDSLDASDSSFESGSVAASGLSPAGAPRGSLPILPPHWRLGGIRDSELRNSVSAAITSSAALIQECHRLAYQTGEAGGTKGDPRPLGEPGSRFEYNDVRINQLSLALLHLFKRPLPEVFEEFFRKPLGCSDDFQWVGYEQGWTQVQGQRMMSVPGGSHWGGGISISAMDQALIGLMLMGNGLYKDQQILSAKWMHMMQQPCDVAPYYGYLIWLNKDGALFKDAPRSSWFAIGAGSSITWVDPQLELVCILRWIDAAKTNDCIAQIMQAL
jgi:CubicO group peptidase (beta-lactamase class C family)